MGNKRHRKTRAIRIVGEIAFIPLTQGKTAIIDAADVHLVEGWNWSASMSKGKWYAQRGASIGNGKSFHLSMHTIISRHVVGFDKLRR